MLCCVVMCCCDGVLYCVVPCRVVVCCVWLYLVVFGLGGVLLCVVTVRVVWFGVLYCVAMR